MPKNARGISLWMNPVSRGRVCSQLARSHACDQLHSTSGSRLKDCLLKENYITTVTVYGFNDPIRWGGFSNWDAFIAYLDSFYGPEVHTSEGPLGEPTYEIDPTLAALMSNPEFHKLSAAVKTEILKDQNLSDAMASFLNNGGTFADTTNQFATWQAGPPPVITVPGSLLSPMSGDVDRAVYAIAHETYHDKFRTLPSGPITPQQWAYNEAVASLEAYRATERMGLYLDLNAFELKASGAIIEIRNSSSDAEAMQKLQVWFEGIAPFGP